MKHCLLHIMLINKVSNIGICLVSPQYLFSQLRKRGVILVKAVLDSRAVTEVREDGRAVT